MSDMERDQQDTGDEAAADAKEDLELTDEDADQVAGGLGQKWVTDSAADHFK